MLDGGEAHVRNILLKRGEKQLTPLYHLFGPPGGDHAIIPCQFQSEIQKQIMLAEVREIARKMGAVAALFMTESWMVKIDQRSSWHARRMLETMDPPSQHPDRIEAVTIAATDGTEKAMRVLQIIRNRPGGKIVSLIEEPPPEDILSRFLDGILPPREPPP
jgi:hypothetical protein